MSIGNPYNKTTTQQSLIIEGLSASALVATDASKQLTSTISGLSPTLTGLTLSGLSASGLVATTAGKALTSSVSGLSPTMTGLTLSGLTASRLLASNGTKGLASADLASWVAGTANQVTVTDDSDGSITLSLPTYTAANLLTACATNAGALDFSAASKTLTVEDNAVVSQDYSSDASPTFAGVSLGTGELTAGSINRATGTLTLEIGGGAEVSITSTTVTLGGNLIIPDGGTIGSASDTDVMTIDASGNTTFSVFPITPSAAPDADYEVSNKKYVDDQISGLSLGGTFVDRGDPGVTHDYAVGDFTLDSTWRDLDLSSIVPAGAKAVLLFVATYHATVDKYFQLRENGDTNGINVVYVASPVASKYAYQPSAVVALDANRVIEYNGESGFTAIQLTVRGWWT